MIPAVYFAAASLYILLSTYLFGSALDYSSAITWVETGKGLAFVALSAAVLWLVLYRQYKARRFSETTFRNLVETIDDAVFVIQIPERIICYANPAALRMFGYTAEELVGKDTALLHSSEDQFLQFGFETATAISGGQAHRGEYERRRKNGELFPSTHSISVFSSDGGGVFAVTVIQDVTLRKQQEATIRENEERFRQFAENLREVLWITDAEKAEMQYVSPAYEAVWGRSVESLYREPASFLEAVHPEDRARVAERVRRQALEEYDVQYRILRPDGEVRWIWDRSVPTRDVRGRVHRVVGIAEDITEMKRRETELVQAQKMEAMGRLTGGIAHDFNNALMVILGNAELLADGMAAGSTAHQQAEGIVQASRRAGELTRRLMAFSRQQTLQQDRIDLNALILEVTTLLDRTLGGNVTVETRLAGGLWPVIADKAQTESCLLNLAVNARDAMPQGGRLVIATGNRHFAADDPARPGTLAPGDYAMLTVSDTGVGMAPELSARVFEPFFTTKEVGKGTGLGLSMVYGFVVQSGGHVAVETAPGAGATFRLYLPRDPAGERPAPAPVPDVPARGAGTVLLVEDDAMVRALVATQLRRLGYAVVEAASGPEALDRLAECGDIALMLTDVMMPGGMSGPQLAVAVRERRPSLPVLFASGYGEQGEFARVGLPPDTPLLRKPFRLGELAQALRRALEG
ncbi:MAG: PAS domain S-box protein [Alphaproteobacteria bacterium]